MSNKRNTLLTRIAQGGLMGAANTVPGVSGGTLALMFGFYERLINALRDGAHAATQVLRGDLKGALASLKAVEWSLLLPLLVGAGAVVIAVAGPLERSLETHPENMAGLFLGLVIGSLIISWRLMPTWNPRLLAVVTLVGTSVFAGLGWQNGPLNDPSPLLLFAAGAIAICAMILPGLSGSFLLLMFGLYEAVLTMVDQRLIGDLVIFGLGAALGLAAFATLLSRLLKRHHDPMLAVLLGLMVGSLRVLWPWPHGVGYTSPTGAQTFDGTGLQWPTQGTTLWPLLLAGGALMVVLGVDALASRQNKA
ncbi:MAG: DUF368 domain-containing protein [Actinobacteria bacterium]|jgi:putative membrane protein|nr:DUF368 domain-containing protein [Actinomycetota bacterium]